MQRNVPHNLIALTAIEKIASLGITVILQQRIGAFAVCLGLFESHLEGAIWKLRNEQVKGVRPSTDKMPVSDWLKLLAKGNDALSANANAVLSVAAIAADNLMDYRHSLFHGTLVGFPDGAFFLRNSQWHGEVRKRPQGDAGVSEELLDMAIETAWILFRVAVAIKQGNLDAALSAQLEAMKAEVKRARSFSGELRHLAILANNEKY